MSIWLLALTDFGDAAVLIPLAAVMLLWLLLGNLRSAAWWAVSVGYFVGLTALSKIFFYGCPPASDIRSPSGHTGFSVLVYGAIALVTTIQARGVRRAGSRHRHRLNPDDGGVAPIARDPQFA